MSLKEKYSQYDPLVISGSLHQSNFRVFLSRKVCQIAHKLFRQFKCDCLHTTLIGTLRFTDTSQLHVVIDKIEVQNVSCRSLLDGIRIPFKILRYKSENGLAEFVKSSVDSIWSYYQTSGHSVIENLGSLRMIACASLLLEKNHSDLNRDSDRFCWFQIWAVSFDCSLRLQTLDNPALIPSILSKSLSTPDFYFTTQTDYLDTSNRETFDTRFGFISTTHSGEFSLHLESDPTVLTSVITGIWISGITDISDLRIWSACVHFLLTPPHKLANANDESFMILALYKPNNPVPSFYRVNFHSLKEVANKYSKSTVFFSKELKKDVETVPICFTLFTSSLHDYLGEMNDVIIKSSKYTDFLNFCLNSNALVSSKLMLDLQDAVINLCSTQNDIIYCGDSNCHSDARTGVRKESTTARIKYTDAMNGNQEINTDPDDSKFGDQPKSFNPILHVPEVSLLIEEGVRTSHVKSEALLTIPTPIVESEESIPRTPRVREYMSESLSPSDKVQYSKVPELPTYVMSPCRDLSESITNIKQNGMSNENNRISLSAFFASLQPEQLRRFEQLISNLLMRKEAEANCPTPTGNYDASNQFVEAPMGISVGVNTTNLMLTNDMIEKVDATCTSKQLNDVDDQVLNPQCDLTNSVSVSSSSQAISLSLLSVATSENINNQTGNGQLINSSRGLHSNQFIDTYSAPVVSNFTGVSSNITSLKSTDSKTEPFEPETGSLDNYNILLANLQSVLDRKYKTKESPCFVKTADPLIAAHYPGYNSLLGTQTSQVISTTSQESHEQSSWRYELCNQESMLKSNDDSLQAMNHEANESAPHDTHVPNWLTFGLDLKTLRVTAANNESIATTKQSNAIFGNMSKKPHQVESNMLEHDQGVRMSKVSNVGINQDIDQSAYLTSLVRKYLGSDAGGLETLCDATNFESRTILTDSSSSVDYSMATQNYMRRHGLINKPSSPVRGSSHTHRPKTITKECNQIITERPASSIPHLLTHSPNSLCKSSELLQNYTIGESLPNILDGLHLDQSPSTDQHRFIIPTDDTGMRMKFSPGPLYLSLDDADVDTMTNYSSTMELDSPNKVILPTIKNAAHVSHDTTVNDDDPILDLEKLRSLPKLL